MEDECAGLCRQRAAPLEVLLIVQKLRHPKYEAWKINSATDSADTVATNSATDAVVADMAEEGAANTAAQTKCTPPVTPRTTNGAAEIFSSTRQDVRPPARDCCTWYSFRSRMIYTFLVSSRRNRKPHSEPRRNLC